MGHGAVRFGTKAAEQEVGHRITRDISRGLDRGSGSYGGSVPESTM